MYSNTSGQYNTSAGSSALYSNINGSFNVANGNEAMRLDTSGSFNTANGFQAMYSNLSGGNNTATGGQSLYSIKTAYYNTATGYQSMFSDTSGNFNTANGHQSLYSNVNGVENTAMGFAALYNNTTAFFNTAVGSNSLNHNTTGGQNTAVGSSALFFNTGTNNIGIGFSAGGQLTGGNNNIDIANNGQGGESNTTRIGNGNQSKTFISGIYGSLTAAGVAVYVDGSGQLGTNPSSARFKEDIEDMRNTSSDLYKLRPVNFRYKEEIAKGSCELQYGLIAEEVEAINTNLVSYDKDGKLFTVKYHLLVPLMLNELQKEHAINQQQEAKIESLQQQINELKELINKGQQVKK
jgi:hypothetical protein